MDKDTNSGCLGCLVAPLVAILTWLLGMGSSSRQSNQGGGTGPWS